MARLEKNFDRIHAKDSNRWSTVSKRSVLPMIRKEEQMKNIRLFLVILLLGMAATAAGQIDEDFEVTPFDFWVPSAGNNSPTPSLSNSYNNTPGYTPGTSVYMQRNTTEREASLAI
jgi:hypothetical protein